MATLTGGIKLGDLIAFHKPTSRDLVYYSNSQADLELIGQMLAERDDTCQIVLRDTDANVVKVLKE